MGMSIMSSPKPFCLLGHFHPGKFSKFFFVLLIILMSRLRIKWEPYLLEPLGTRLRTLKRAVTNRFAGGS